MSDMERNYWALESKDEDMVQNIRSKWDEFFDYFKSTVIHTRVARSYRYYHNLYYEESLVGDAVKLTGDELEQRRVSANQYRSTLTLLKTFVTSQKPEWDSLATAADSEALEATKLSNSILDSYMHDPDTNVLSRLRQSVEDSLVLSAGYLWTLWNPEKGEELDADEINETIDYAGDFEFCNPSVFDVAFDPAVRDFRDSRWVTVRRRENRWDLLAQHPDLEDHLIGKEPSEDEAEEDSLQYLNLQSPELKDEDWLWVYYFYHKPSPAVPNGRFVRFVAQEVLEDRDLDEKHIPLHRLVPSQYLLTCFGYTPGFDVQPAQEALNAVLSILLTNQNALGNNKIWFKQGEPINQADLEPGVSVISTNTPPQSLNFLQSAPELPKSVELYNLLIEQQTGVNATSRGNAPPNLKSGAAMAMMDSRTLQAASDLIANFQQFMADVGTSIIKTLAARATESRQLALVGVNGARFLKDFNSEMLKPISKVRITTGNPLMNTLSGATNMAEFLAQTGLVTTPEEILTVVKTGSLDRLTEHNESQLRAAQAENDALLQGQAPKMLLIDNHRFHILKHVSILDTPTSRSDETIGAATMAHIGEHIQAMADPMSQQLSALLGYANPMAGPGGPAGGPNPPQKPGQATPGAPTGTPASNKGKEPPDAVDSRVQDARNAASQ